LLKYWKFHPEGEDAADASDAARHPELEPSQAEVQRGGTVRRVETGSEATHVEREVDAAPPQPPASDHAHAPPPASVPSGGRWGGKLFRSRVDLREEEADTRQREEEERRIPKQGTGGKDGGGGEKRVRKKVPVIFFDEAHKLCVSFCVWEEWLADG
jgi:hypothetical protein